MIPASLVTRRPHKTRQGFISRRIFLYEWVPPSSIEKYRYCIGEALGVIVDREDTAG